MSASSRAPSRPAPGVLLCVFALCWQLEAPSAVRGSGSVVARERNGKAAPLPATSERQRKILFATGRSNAEPGQMDIFAMNGDGSGLTNLTRSKAIEFDPGWSPDGRQIAFAVLTLQKTGEDTEERRADIFVMNADGSRRRRLTRLNTLAFCPTWSLDGRRIAFSTLPRGSDPPRFYVIGQDGRNLKRLGEGMMPAWSPDGKKLLYTVLIDKGEGEQTAHLRVMDAGTGGAKTLADGMMGAWSPDGKRIASVAAGEASTDLFVMNADGSQRKQLTRTAQLELSPQWSADGRRLFFVRSNDLFGWDDEVERPESVIFVMEVEGRSEKPLTGKDSLIAMRGEVALSVYIGEMIAAALSAMFSR